MTENEYVTRAELQTILDDLTRQVTDGFASLAAHAATRATLADTTAQVNRALAELYATRATQVGDQPTIVVNVEPTPVTVEVTADVALPARLSTTTVERNVHGLITKTTTEEHDA